MTSSTLIPATRSEAPTGTTMIAEARKGDAPDIRYVITQLSFVGELPNGQILALIIFEAAKRAEVNHVWSADAEHLYVRHDEAMAPQSVLTHVTTVARPLFGACQLEITTATS